MVKQAMVVGSADFMSFLTLLFIGLKLTKHIDWSWWWVLGPIWIPAAVGFAGLCAIAIYAAIVEYIRAPGEDDLDQ